MSARQAKLRQFSVSQWGLPVQFLETKKKDLSKLNVVKKRKEMDEIRRENLRIYSRIVTIQRKNTQVSNIRGAKMDIRQKQIANYLAKKMVDNQFSSRSQAELVPAREDSLGTRSN
jgi:hypothetical protein